MLDLDPRFISLRYGVINEKGEFVGAFMLLTDAEGLQREAPDRYTIVDIPHPSRKAVIHAYLYSGGPS